MWTVTPQNRGHSTLEGGQQCPAFTPSRVSAVGGLGAQALAAEVGPSQDQFYIIFGIASGSRTSELNFLVLPESPH